jgi:uncharacterized protein (TIGR02611 family)
MGTVARYRERLVLGHVRRSLEHDERVLAWAHARVPDVRAPGVLLITQRRCLLHLATRDVDDHTTAWLGLRRWYLERPSGSRVRLGLVTDAGEAVSELSLSSRARATSASRVLSAIADCTQLPCEDGGPNPDPAGPLRRRWRRPPLLTAVPRSPRDHARRVGVTIAGIVVLIISALFASPFVPGPGALTAVAGIAILAREYEWARDLHVWSIRQLERFLAWMHVKKAALLTRRRPEDEPADPLREVA